MPFLSISLTYEKPTSLILLKSSKLQREPGVRRLINCYPSSFIALSAIIIAPTS
ncbi:MAG: hypothetical protein ACTHKF_06045 [Candidatus Nitrosocosmicus sp.]